MSEDKPACGHTWEQYYADHGCSACCEKELKDTRGLRGDPMDKLKISYLKDKLRRASLAADQAIARAYALKRALLQTRFWGSEYNSETWCWCPEQPCSDVGCEIARAALRGMGPELSKEQETELRGLKVDFIIVDELLDPPGRKQE